eukprot:3629337-Lingulodinium_polyedra.AAC.1
MQGTGLPESAQGGAPASTATSPAPCYWVPSGPSWLPPSWQGLLAFCKSLSDRAPAAMPANPQGSTAFGSAPGNP